MLNDRQGKVVTLFKRQKVALAGLLACSQQHFVRDGKEKEGVWCMQTYIAMGHSSSDPPKYRKSNGNVKWQCWSLLSYTKLQWCSKNTALT